MKYLFMLLVLISCSHHNDHKLTTDTAICYDKTTVVEGMLPGEVEQILGKPEDVIKSSNEGQTQLIYLYDETLVKFTDGKVTEVFHHGK